MKLSEDILHFVWKNALFDIYELLSEDGEEILVQNRGNHNLNAGPDFSEARIKIGETLWVGQVEMHIRSSDWYLHNHHGDPAYKNVILHVVYFHDKDVFINEQKIPVLVLKNRIKPGLFNKYKELSDSGFSVPCFRQISKVEKLVVVSQIEKSLSERLIKKSQEVFKILKQTDGNWEEATFRLLAFQIVGKLNRGPMEWVLQDLRISRLGSITDSSEKLESVLFGSAGLLEKSNDEYTVKLYKEYQHQKRKFKLNSINGILWKYGRIRPPQFPEFRIAQLAAVIRKHPNLFSAIINSPDYYAMKKMLDVSVSEYWKNHFLFGKESKANTGEMSDAQKDILIINCFIPTLFSFAELQNNDELKERLVAILLAIKPEKNHIISKWNEAGLEVSSAFDSQGLIELYNNRCIQKKCLTCNVGTNLLGHDSKN